MLIRFTKAIIYGVLLTSSSVLGFPVSVILINEIANNETLPPRFPDCDSPASKEWCNSYWPIRSNSQLSLDENGLKACYQDQKCCPHPESPTQFSGCPNYGGYFISYSVLSLTGLTFLFTGEVNGSTRKKILSFLGSILLAGGFGGMLGTIVTYSSNDPSSEILLNNSIGVGLGIIAGGMIWKRKRNRAVLGHAVVLPGVAAVPPPAPQHCIIL